MQNVKSATIEQVLRSKRATPIEVEKFKEYVEIIFPHKQIMQKSSGNTQFNALEALAESAVIKSFST